MSELAFPKETVRFIPSITVVGVSFENIEFLRAAIPVIDSRKSGGVSTN